MAWAKARTTEFPTVDHRPGRHRRGRRALIVIAAVGVLAVVGAAAAVPLLFDRPSAPLAGAPTTGPGTVPAGTGDTSAEPALATTLAPPPTTPARPTPSPTPRTSTATSTAQRIAPRPPAATPMPDLENAVLELTNQARAAQHCRALRMDSHLLTAARLHSADMAANNYFSHTSKDKRGPAQRMAAAGYDTSRGWAENIAAGYPTAEAVMAGWMGSPGHRANIENCGLRSIGIGVARGANGWLYWTQDFGGR